MNTIDMPGPSGALLCAEENGCEECDALARAMEDVGAR